MGNEDLTLCFFPLFLSDPFVSFLSARMTFCAGPVGLLFCWVVFLAYQVQIPYFILGKWIEDPYVTAAVFCAPVMAGVVSWVIGREFGGMTINEGSDDGIGAGKG